VHLGEASPQILRKLPQNELAFAPRPLRLPRHPRRLSRYILLPLPETKSWSVPLLHSSTPNPLLNYSAAASLSLAPYFPPHTQRNIYFSLLHLSDDAGANEKAPKVPDSILRAALLARAQEDITRIIEIRTRKQALSTLLQRGVVGDEIWQRLLRAEQELELEVKDVVQEVWPLFPGART
jgi:Preprotein translocase subunit Sec66